MPQPPTDSHLFTSDLHVHIGEAKVIKVNADSTEPVTLERNGFEEVETFTYLGSIIDKRVVQMRKARGAFM